MSDLPMASTQSAWRADCDAPVHTLDLLSPWALAPELPLASEHRAPVRRALGELLRALDAPSGEALTLIGLALAGLPDDAPQPIELHATDTPLSAAEVQDYDRYFGLRHVQSPAPGVCLVRSLLVMTRAFVALCASTSGLDEQAIAVQKDGLRCQAGVLARVLGLDSANAAADDHP